MTQKSDIPTASSQEEFYKLNDAHTKAAVDTMLERTVYLMGEEEWPEEEDLYEYLTIAHDVGTFRGTEAERHAHNERAIKLARLLDAQHKLDLFLSRPENQGKSFRVFSDEVIARAFDNDLDEVDLGDEDLWGGP